MIALLYGGPVVLGFLAGYFFQAPMLRVLSLLSVAAAIYLLLTAREIELLFAIAFTFCVVVGNATMWVTHYGRSSSTIVGDFLRRNVLR